MCKGISGTGKIVHRHRGSTGITTRRHKLDFIRKAIHCADFTINCQTRRSIVIISRKDKYIDKINLSLGLLYKPRDRGFEN